ncbi:hypothetical protein lbkm_2779 [Lachnospiraceae bacterium KM106-2]|nr:hypothetical protein lbkm_2779 [Lachnospiraceae bacterium KM106-2]
MLGNNRPSCLTGEEQDRDYWLERKSKIERIQRGIQQNINDLEKSYFITFMDRVKGVVSEAEYRAVKKDVRKKITYYQKKLKIMNYERKICCDNIEKD